MRFSLRSLLAWFKVAIARADPLGRSGPIDRALQQPRRDTPERTPRPEPRRPRTEMAGPNLSPAKHDARPSR